MLHTEETRISSGHLGLWLVCAFFNGEGKTLIVCWLKIAITPSTFLFHLAPPCFFHFSLPCLFFCWPFICLQVKIISKEVQYCWLVEQDNSDLLLHYYPFWKSLVVHNWMFTWKTKLMENCMMHAFSSLNDRTDCLTYYHYYYHLY